MGRLTRALAAAALAASGTLVASEPAAAFDGFGAATADSTYDRQIRFDVELSGAPPDRLELLLRTPGSDASFVIPVDADGDSATYVWNTAADYVTPNTLITYQWRAIEGDDAVLSPEGTIRYEDDRPGLDWQSELLGETTVHWYGDAAAQARRFGELAAVGVDQGEALLGTELAGPVDVFVYDTREEFFGALGPTVREWTGAAAVSPIRTIFMWLGGGPPDDLETAMVHEITHVVFFDATDNPFHHPATWVNEGIASWSEERDATGAAQFVRQHAASRGLFAFDAITERFPIDDLDGSLAYAQGTALIDLIIDRYGEEAIGRLTAAYRDGASDAEALEAASGVPANELYAQFYAEFGVDAPTAVEPEPIPASEVDKPAAGEVDPGGVDATPQASGRLGAQPGEPDPAPAGAARWLPIAALVAAVAVIAVLAFVLGRRATGSDAA